MDGKENIRLLLADDEPLARQRLKRLINGLDASYQVIAEASDGQQALDLAQQHRPDIILLDINMPDLDGLATADKLRQLPQPPVIIFVTAYEQYALSAFDKQAIDYLLKPVKQQRLQQALARARQLLPTPAPPMLAIKQQQQLQQIAVDRIYYFRAEQKYIIMRCRHHEYLLEQALKQLQQAYPQFIRIHRNALVAPQHLSGIKKTAGKTYVLFHHINDQLEISRRHLAEITRLFK